MTLIGDSGKLWGAAIRSTDESKNPIIVSQGHKVSLMTAIEVVKAVTKVRVPEPIRYADLQSRQHVKRIYNSDAA